MQDSPASKYSEAEIHAMIILYANDMHLCQILAGKMANDNM